MRKEQDFKILETNVCDCNEYKLMNYYVVLPYMKMLGCKVVTFCGCYVLGAPHLFSLILFDVQWLSLIFNNLII